MVDVDEVDEVDLGCVLVGAVPVEFFALGFVDFGTVVVVVTLLDPEAAAAALAAAKIWFSIAAMSSWYWPSCPCASAACALV